MERNNMEPISWELSETKIEESTFVKPVEGRQIFKVLEASHNKDKATIDLKLWSALNGATVYVTHKLKKASKIDGSLVDNQATFRTLFGLSKAIYGPELAQKCTIPNLDQLVGCAVLGELKISPYDYQVPKFDEAGQPVLGADGMQVMEKKHRDYNNIYEYFPICASDVSTYSDHPDQYSVADDTE